MGGPLGGLHALVTGGGSGIGAACALALAQHGATVTVLGRRADALTAVGAAGVAVADVTDSAALAASIAEAAAARGNIAILVNAAGAAESAPFARADDALWDRMLAVNLRGAVNAIRAVLPGMLERRQGRIVTIASTAGLKGYAYVTAYTAAKHAVIGLTRALAQEVATKGITVNAVCPGFTDTDLVAESVARIVSTTGRDAAAARAELARHNPQGRLLRPEEVAAAVVALCLPGASGINGQSIAVDGGET